MSRLTIKSFHAPPSPHSPPLAPATSPLDPASGGTSGAEAAGTVDLAPHRAPEAHTANRCAPDGRAASAAPSIDPDLLPLAEYLQVFERTEGWFSVESAAIWDSLLDYQQRRQWRGHQLEIGVYHGKSAALMAQRLRGNDELFLVDRFLAREAVERAVGALRPLPNPRVHLIERDSHTLAALDLLQGRERSFRFIHIDGEHSAAAIQNDLDLAHRFGSSQVLVSVDDIFQFVYPQLTESLFRYLRQYPDRFCLVMVGFNKAYLARPNHAHEYLVYIAEELGPRLERIGIETTLSKSSYPAELNAFGIGPRLECGARRGFDHAPDQIMY